MTKNGFLFENKQILYIDPVGKYAHQNIWRADCYYHPNFAKSVFFTDENKYIFFLNIHAKHCFATYGDFCKSYKN